PGEARRIHGAEVHHEHPDDRQRPGDIDAQEALAEAHPAGRRLAWPGGARRPASHAPAPFKTRSGQGFPCPLESSAARAKCRYSSAARTSSTIWATEMRPPPDRYQTAGCRSMMFPFWYARVILTRSFSMVALADDWPPMAAVRSMTNRYSGFFSRMYSKEMLWPWVEATIPASTGGKPKSSWIMPYREPGP